MRPFWALFHPNLHDFLSHLSSPVGLLEDELHEVRVFDAFANLAGKNLPRSEKIVKMGQEEEPEGNHHKRIREGFQKAFQAMATEDKATKRAKLRESTKVLRNFYQSRGFRVPASLTNRNNKMQPREEFLGQNRKLKKGEAHITGLSLAPHHLNGLSRFDVCPNSSKECRENCLGTESGGGRIFADHALSSKVARTHALVFHPEHFARVLDANIEAHERRSKRRGVQPVVRLNVTSDIPWEHVAPQMFQNHPNVQFYDYSKNPQRVMKQGTHPNYMLALSHTGTGHDESNDHHVVKALEAGRLVAMVHKRGKGSPRPTHVEDVQTGKRYPIVNGDKDDMLPNRFSRAGRTHGSPGHGVVSSLTLKGSANHQAGNFANTVDDDGIIRINKRKP